MSLSRNSSKKSSDLLSLVRLAGKFLKPEVSVKSAVGTLTSEVHMNSSAVSFLEGRLRRVLLVSVVLAVGVTTEASSEVTTEVSAP